MSVKFGFAGVDSRNPVLIYCLSVSYGQLFGIAVVACCDLQYLKPSLLTCCEGHVGKTQSLKQRIWNLCFLLW